MKRHALTVLAFCIFLLGAIKLFEQIQGMQHQAVQRDVKNLVSTLRTSGELHPVIGAVAPLLELSGEGDPYFLIVHDNGDRIDGNITGTEPMFHSRPAGEVGKYMVHDDSGRVRAIGAWFHLDQTVRIFVGKPIAQWPPSAIFAYWLAVVGLLCLLAVAIYWDWVSGYRHNRAFHSYLRALEGAVSDRKQSALQAPYLEQGALAQLAGRVSDIVTQLKSERHREFQFHRAMEHEVLLYIRRALDIIDSTLDDAAITKLEAKLTRAEQNFLGLMELDSIGVVLRENFYPVSLELCLREIIETFETDALQRDIKVILQLAASRIPPALGIRKHFDLMFSNLIVNAIHYSPVGSEVEVRLECSDDYRPVVRIRDCGMGLKGFHPSFDPVTGPSTIGLRGRAGADRHTGTGVGLMIAYTEAELLGAHMMMRDRVPGAEYPGLEITVTPQATMDKAASAAGFIG